jgi:hypothetical protein
MPGSVKIDNEPKISASATFWVPGPKSTDRRTAFSVVLVRGAIGDYVAYIAAGDDLEFARKHGEKLTFDQAVAYFPSMVLAEARYRK